MDVDESKIGEWPNVALVPGTHIHAATGEYVEQPENTRIGRSRGADGPQAAEPEPEHAGAGSGVQDGAECVDTREKLEADVDRMVKEHGLYWLRTYIIEWLDRQAAITAREVSDSYEHKAERQSDRIFELHNKLADALERVDSLTAERDYLMRITEELEERNGELLESRAHWIDQAVSIYRRFYPGNEYAVPADVCRIVITKIDELTAERDELKAEVEAQRKRANDAERGVLSEEWYVCRDRYEDDIAELTAERDELQRQLLDNIDTDMAIENTQLHCEVNDLLEERDSLREKNSNQRRQLSELQDAIHERNEGVLKRQWQRRIDELTAERNEWQRTAEDYQNCYDMAVKRGQNRLSKIDELTAERDYWKDQMCRCLKYVTSGYKPDIMKWPLDERKFCEPCLLVIDEADHLRDVVIQQAENFKKLEAELKAADDTANTLRASVAGLKETVENQKVEILRLKDENAELCMKVHGAPF